MIWFLFNLRLAYSTELGASTAYRGHARSTLDPVAAHNIREIEAEELAHREAVGAILERFGARPSRLLELLFLVVGSTVALGCQYWGDWASAFGAAQFEFGGAADYGRCARIATSLGYEDLAEQLTRYRDEELAHRVYFLELAQACWPPLILRAKAR